MSFDTVYRANYAAIYQYCFRLLGSAEEAKDVTQETFVRLYNSNQSERDIDNVPAWLYRVATNLSTNLVRNRKRRTELLNEHRRDEASPLNAEQELIRKEEVAKIRQKIEQLPMRDQALLNLYQDHRSYSEIAQILGIKKNSVGTLLARAIAKLQLSGASRVPK